MYNHLKSLDGGNELSNFLYFILFYFINAKVSKIKLSNLRWQFKDYGQLNDTALTRILYSTLAQVVFFL